MGGGSVVGSIIFLNMFIYNIVQYKYSRLASRVYDYNYLLALAGCWVVRMEMYLARCGVAECMMAISLLC